MPVDVALCIGINRYGHGSDLSGCVNDCRDWADALERRGATVFEIEDAAATGANLRESMTDLVRSLKRGQTGVITYSGHGSWTPDRDGDELDRRDEMICPVDVFDKGGILDDDLLDIFEQRAYGSRVVMVSDSCHSGTVNRLAAPITADGDRPARRVRFLPPEHFLSGGELERARGIGAARASKSRSSALLLSGCSDVEYSYDAWFQVGGRWRANGAFTWAAINALRGLPEKASYRDWHRQIRTILPSQDYPQTPLLTGTSTQKRWPAL